ncbi:MAG: class I SAM-dependent methyltransferase [Tabrizicola sp.]|nr:class I SAM-dependent methyltransferase [Tabrizicola sp.]
MSKIKHAIKTVGGSFLEFACPAAVRELDSNIRSGRYLKAKRWILHARTERAKRRGTAEDLQKSLFQTWQTDVSDGYFEQYLDRFQKWFLGPHHEIVDELATLSRSGRYHRLVEVGCGAGRVLEHLSKAMPEVPSFIGVDINEGIVARNQTEYAADPRLTFLAADAAIWLKETAMPGTILMTYGGVMEYFSAETLTALFKSLAANGPAAVALVEPVDPGHDLEGDTASHVFGGENSFSHNHAHLLRQAGYRIRFRKTLDLGLVSWIMILAETEHPSQAGA